MSRRAFIESVELKGPQRNEALGHSVPRIMRVEERDDSKETPPATVDGGSIVAWGNGVGPQNKSDVLNSTLFAQLAANNVHDRFTDGRNWYIHYTTVLAVLGWGISAGNFMYRMNDSDGFRMDKAVLEIIKKAVGGDKLEALTAGLSALESKNPDDKTVTIFESSSFDGSMGSFQLGEATADSDGFVSLALGAFHFQVRDDRSRFLFFEWGSREVNYWWDVQKVVLNQNHYDGVRGAVANRLASYTVDYIEDIDLGPPARELAPSLPTAEN